MSGLLRICTAGSVDDGKSTLLGRLLFESRGVYEDQVKSVEAASRNRGAGPIDFSLFTDGLRAEREQGITIDVAYRYFATARRKFILADTPGHEQYTRNMATGASTADMAIVLVDARNGIRPQSRLHARIAGLLGIREFVLAVNKMDLVGFDENVFRRIVEEFMTLVPEARVQAIPISALNGDNVTTRSTNAPWYDGPDLLTWLETVPVKNGHADAPLRYPVQLVLRQSGEFRGFAGRIASGTLRPNDDVQIWPSGKRSRVRRIATRDGDLAVATAGMSVAITLADELDLSRGDMISSVPHSLNASGLPHQCDHHAPKLASRFEADIVWMDERPLDPEKTYRIKLASQSAAAYASATLALNEIGTVTISTSKPLVFDTYQFNRVTGAFVLIDSHSNFTAGAGMITRALADQTAETRWDDAAERIVRLVRGTPDNQEALEGVRIALEDLLK